MSKTTGASGAHYDPADFCIPAQDHQGHSERLYCRVQPLIDRQIDVVLRSKNWPFRTKGDVMRWAIVRGLKVLEVMEPEVRTRGFMQQAESITNLMRNEIYQQEFQGIFDKLNEVVNRHITMGAQGEAVRLLAETKYHFEQIEGEPFWRQKALDTLKQKFGHLMGVQRAASLSAAASASPFSSVAALLPTSSNNGDENDAE